MSPFTACIVQTTSLPYDKQGNLDRALRARELEERIVVPAQIPEFVLLHSDSVEASGFVQHIKLPHYVDFQAQLSLIRGLRAKSGKKEENQE